MDRLRPAHIVHDLSWMGAMVSRSDAKAVFGRAFSRPPRLFMFNPVCTIFSVYYAYIYGTSTYPGHELTCRDHLHFPGLRAVTLWLSAVQQGRLVLVRVAAVHHLPVIHRFRWVQAMTDDRVRPLSDGTSAIGFACAATTAANVQDRIYKYLSGRNDGRGEPEYRVRLLSASGGGNMR